MSTHAHAQYSSTFSDKYPKRALHASELQRERFATRCLSINQPIIPLLNQGRHPQYTVPSTLYDSTVSAALYKYCSAELRTCRKRDTTNHLFRRHVFQLYTRTSIVHIMPFILAIQPHRPRLAHFSTYGLQAAQLVVAYYHSVWVRQSRMSVDFLRFFFFSILAL